VVLFFVTYGEQLRRYTLFTSVTKSYGVVAGVKVRQAEHETGIVNFTDVFQFTRTKIMLRCGQPWQKSECPRNLPAYKTPQRFVHSVQSMFKFVSLLLLTHAHRLPKRHGEV
jgi:hypothetical protein